MLYRIFGRAGSGKTQYMISCLKEMQSTGVDCLFLVPEQQSVDTELLLEACGATALGTEVLNFQRLPNHVFRKLGGLVSRDVDALGKLVLVRRAVWELGNSLKLYQNPSGATVAELADTVTALKRLGITPGALKATAEKLKYGNDRGLKSKLYELVQIYGKYAQLLGNDKCDDADGLVRLAALLKEKDFFANTAVFIDGIYTYTPAQYEIIGLIAQSAPCLYISFLADEDETGIFNDTCACARRVKDICATSVTDVFMPENRRAEEDALLYCESKLWQSAPPYGKRADCISLAACKDRYDESLRAAAEIYALKEKGYRFDNIAIACRHPESYSGVLDAVLEKYGIPFYFASKDSAATKPLGAFIMGLLDMAAEKTPLWAVKKYLKSTFSLLSERETDEILHYGESWHLSGKAWTADKDWLMNPSGYTDRFTPADEALLRRINGARATFAASVAPVLEGLRAKDLTVGAGVKLIYAHLKECGAAAKLAAAAEKLARMGDADGGAKTASLWGVTVDILDRLYELAGDMPIDAGGLGAIISAMLEGSSIGAIPSYTDAVSIGDARLMRSDGIKAMIILGVNEGEFPSMPQKSGIFSSKESATLESEGIELLPGTDKAIDQERFFFYVCTAAPSRYLSVSYVQGDGGRPSPAFSVLSALFPHNEVKVFGKDERDYMFCAKAAEDVYPYLKNAALKAALGRHLNAMGIASAGAGAPPLQDSTAYVNEKNVKTLWLSYSRIDCYNNCGFNYLLNYELKLRDDRRISFSAVDTGRLLHRIMEEYMQNRMASGSFVPADGEETKAEVDAITESYMSSVLPQKPSKRLLKQTERLKNVAVYVCNSLCDEFNHTSFVPTGFEVSIGNGGIVPPAVISPKGRQVQMRGSIDRVDTAFIDGKKYVRVVDYKSSKKSVTPAMLERGEGIQMLYYMYTYCDADSEGALPAGVLYRSFLLPEKGKGDLQRGIVTDDKQVVDAMDDRGKRGHLSVKEASHEELALYKQQIFGHIAETADRITDGDMCVGPFKKQKTDCTFCPYGEVCRQKQESSFFS